jgi:general secretion pathway protein C
VLDSGAAGVNSLSTNGLTMLPPGMIRNSIRALPFGMLATAAYYGARGTSALVGARLVPDAQTLIGAPPTPAPPRQQSTREPGGAQVILARNAFDSVTGPLYPAQTSLGERPVVAAPTDPLHAPHCEHIHVYSTAVWSEPTWSTAVIQGPGEQHGRVRHPGDDVGGHQVVYIGFNALDMSPSVWLASGGEVCQAELFDHNPRTGAAPAPKKVPPPPKPLAGRGALPPDLKKKIEKLSDGEFAVDRSAVDVIMNDYSRLMRGTRVLPVQKGGKVSGLRLFGVREGSLLQTLGLRNGDEVQSINGFQLSSPEKALQAYARLRTASHITVQIVRFGKPTSIDLAIR